MSASPRLVGLPFAYYFPLRPFPSVSEVQGINPRRRHASIASTPTEADTPSSSSHAAPTLRSALPSQQAGAYQGYKRQGREHGAHPVPEVPRTLVGIPLLGQYLRRSIWVHGGELVAHRRVHEHGQEEAASHVEHAGQSDE